MLAKNRDGRIIKVEGNPLHPIGGGKLCARGQASLQRLYHPDRYPRPMRPDGPESEDSELGRGRGPAGGPAQGATGRAAAAGSSS